MPNERLNEDAAAWVARLAQPHDGATLAAFEAWRDASLDHLVAYERHRATWERLRGIAAVRAPDAVPDPDAVKPRSEVPERRLFTRRSAVFAAGVVAAFGGGAAFWLLQDPAAYATGIGQQRMVFLKDGSTAELNTDSMLRVGYSCAARQIDLQRGEAMFHAVADERPFHVRGGWFDLYTQAADMAVRLTGRGSAQVLVRSGYAAASLGAGTGRMVALPPRSRAWLTPANIHVTPLQDAEAARLLAWQEGALSFDGQSLAEAAEEFNRYNRRKLVVDGAVARLQVGGYFRTSDLDGFVFALINSFPVHAADVGDSEIILTRKG